MDFFKNEIDKLTEVVNNEDRYKISTILSGFAAESSRIGRAITMAEFSDEEYVYDDSDFTQLYSELKSLFIKYGFNNVYTNVTEISEMREVILQMQKEIFDARKL